MMKRKLQTKDDPSCLNHALSTFPWLARGHVLAATGRLSLLLKIDC